MKRCFMLTGMLALALFSGCELLGLEPKEDEDEIRRNFLISRTWIPITVMNEGVDVTSEFEDFELNFSSAFINTRNGGLAFPSEIGWQFGTDENTILRDDNVIMTVSQVNEGSFTYRLRFTVDDPDARKKGIYGEYDFRFEAD